MKHLILLIAIVLTNCTVVKNYHYEIPTRTIKTDSIQPISFEERVFFEYTKCGERLLKDSLISISPTEFARAATIVAYCESGLKTNVKSGDNSVGIHQITVTNLLNLKTSPEEYTNMDVSEQIKIHEKFLRSVNRRFLKSMKTPIDFHIINFSPSKYNKNILSSTSNKYLKALDKNHDRLITVIDFVLFQDARINHSKNKFIRDLYYSITI